MPPLELPPDFAKCGGSENHSLQTMNIGLDEAGTGATRFNQLNQIRHGLDAILQQFNNV